MTLQKLSQLPGASYVAQRGVVLIVSLVILLVITLIGTSVLRTATLEERMAANVRDYDIAFQRAEAAMIEGGEDVEELIGLSAFTANCTDGLCSARDYNEADDRWRDDSFCGGEGIWKDGCSQHRTVTESGEVIAKYIIEHFSEHSSEEDILNMGNIGDSVGGGDVTIFRITTIGYGGSKTTRIMLQSMYGKRF